MKTRDAWVLSEGRVMLRGRDNVDSSEMRVANLILNNVWNTSNIQLAFEEDGA